jgi:hypothetical protein
LARRIVAEKELDLARVEADLAKTTDKDRRKKLQARRDALTKLLAKLRDFTRNVWLINRVRADSLTGKGILKKLAQWQNEQKQGMDVIGDEGIEESNDAAEEEASDEEGAEDAFVAGKKKRATRQPQLLRPFVAGRDKLLLLYDVVARDRVIGPAPEAKPGQARLLPMKGAKALTDNFAVAVFPGVQGAEGSIWEDDQQLFVIPFQKVWHEVARLRRAFPGKTCTLYRNGTLIYVPEGNRKGCWRIASIKRNEGTGISFDLVEPDGIRGGKGNAPVATLLLDGMKVVPCGLSGHDVRQSSDPK